MSFSISRRRRELIDEIRQNLIAHKYGSDLSKVKFIQVDTKLHFFFKDGEPELFEYGGIELGTFLIGKSADGVTVSVDPAVIELIREHKNVVVEVDNGGDGCFYWTKSTVRNRDTGEDIQSFSETV